MSARDSQKSRVNRSKHHWLNSFFEVKNAGNDNIVAFRSAEIVRQMQIRYSNLQIYKLFRTKWRARKKRRKITNCFDEIICQYTLQCKRNLCKWRKTKINRSIIYIEKNKLVPSILISLYQICFYGGAKRYRNLYFITEVRNISLQRYASKVERVFFFSLFTKMHRKAISFNVATKGD